MRVRSHLLCTSLTVGCLLLCLMQGYAGAADELAPPLSVEWVFSKEADASNATKPLVVGDRVYVTLGGKLYCLDARTGAQQWEFALEVGGVSTSPVGWEDLVMVGATDSYLYALDAARGTRQWRHLCEGPVSPDPLVVGDLVMLGGGGKVYALSASSGHLEWECLLASPAKAGPVSDGSMLYFVGEDGEVQCVDMTAPRFRWSAPIERGPRTFGPVAAERGVIVASGQQLFFVSRGSGRSRAKEAPAGIGAAPVVVDDTLYLPAVDGQVYALYPESGVRQGGPELKVGLAVTAPPLVTERYVVAGTGNGVIFLLDRASGSILWSYRCVAPEQLVGEGATLGIYAPMVAAGGRLYCLSATGDLYCFSATAPDAAGPRFSDLRPEPGSAQAVDAFFEIGFAVIDHGSGLDVSSLSATLDGAAAKVSFDVVSGTGTVASSKLADGTHIVKVTARDYRGNVSTAEWSFLTDESLAPEAAQAGRMTTQSLPRR